MMPKKTIIFVNQSSGYLMIDIVNAFTDIYDEKILLAGSINSRNKPLNKGIKVHKIIGYKRTSVFKRLIPWVVGSIQALFFIKSKSRKAYLFLVSNPPFAPLLPLFCKNTFSILIYDIFPDMLVENHILKKNSFIVKQWQCANHKVFIKAHRIFTLTEGMKTTLSQYVSKEKITVVPLWTDNSFIKPIPKGENPFILEQELEGKFVVLYSGNLGEMHHVEVMIELAKLIKTPKIFFLIIGKGEKYNSMERKIKDYNLRNIRMLPWQYADKLPYTLGAADLGVVILNKNISRLSVPSKTYDLMSVGVPMLCVAGPDSELNKLMIKYETGKCFEPDQLLSMCEFIINLSQDEVLYQKYSQNALRSSAYYSPENAKRFLN